MFAWSCPWLFPPRQPSEGVVSAQGGSDQMIITLATELSRQRALTDVESRWLEAAIRREDRRNGCKRSFWTRAEDRRLKRFLVRGKKVREIAPLMNKTEQAVWSRIRVLRGHTGHRGRAAQGFVEAVGAEA